MNKRCVSINLNNIEHIKYRDKIILMLILSLIVFSIFYGEILGFCIEKVNYYTNCKDSYLVVGDLKKNFSYNNNGDIGGLEYGNYSLRDNSSGIIYKVDIEDLGCDLSENSKEVLVGYGESKIPVGHLE